MTYEEVDELIEAWHNCSEDIPVYEYLGWTRDEYMLWVEKLIIPERFMVQATKEKTVTIHLKLSQAEADWLKNWMQNPLTPTHDPAEESEEDKAMRHSFWEALGGDPKIDQGPEDYNPSFVSRGIDHRDLE